MGRPHSGHASSLIRMSRPLVPTTPAASARAFRGPRKNRISRRAMGHWRSADARTRPASPPSPNPASRNRSGCLLAEINACRRSFAPDRCCRASRSAGTGSRHCGITRLPNIARSSAVCRVAAWPKSIEATNSPARPATSIPAYPADACVGIADNAARGQFLGGDPQSLRQRVERAEATHRCMPSRVKFCARTCLRLQHPHRLDDAVGVVRHTRLGLHCDRWPDCRRVFIHDCVDDVHRRPHGGYRLAQRGGVQPDPSLDAEAQGVRCPRGDPEAADVAAATEARHDVGDRGEFELGPAVESELRCPPAKRREQDIERPHANDPLPAHRSARAAGHTYNDDPRAKPISRRPSTRWSTMPISSASMSGWWNGATMTLVPSLDAPGAMRHVRDVHQRVLARSIDG